MPALRSRAPEQGGSPTVAPRRHPATLVPPARRGTLLVLAVAALAGLVRLPFLTLPLGPDEGGLLMVAGQWHPGTSLYGDYWVDRPPVLVDVFALASHLGGSLALRLIGVVLVVTSVLLAGRVGRLVAGSQPTASVAAVAAAVTAALLLSNPLLGVLEVNAELVAAPAVLGAVCAALGAARADSVAGRARWLVVAGGLGALAVLVKQNELDALVLVAVGALTFLAGRGERRTALLLPAVGALAVTAAVVAQAAALGTSPAGLWDAVVTFRLQASHVIMTSAPPAATDRAPQLLVHLVASGAPLLLVVGAVHLPLRPSTGALDVRWATLAVLAWETVSVVLGGSWWSHYLICLVPGLVLLVAQVAARGARRGSARSWSLRTALAVMAVSTTAALTAYLTVPGLTAPDPVVAWLRDHATPGETGVVVLGHPEYLASSGLRSPYSELWSLPVRVRDPQLHHLTAVLRGPHRPDWVVTGAQGRIGGWGIDAPDAQETFDHRYRLVADVGDRLVFRARRDQAEARSTSAGPGTGARRA